MIEWNIDMKAAPDDGTLFLAALEVYTTKGVFSSGIFTSSPTLTARYPMILSKAGPWKITRNGRRSQCGPTCCAMTAEGL